MIFGLSEEQYELYKKAEEEVSNEHPYKCVCGRMTTGLHERNCSAFRKSVERRYFKLWKKQNEGKAGVGYKMTMVDEKKLTFQERATEFKKAVLRAEKKYGVSIQAGYINSWDDSENLLIQELNDCEVINEVYFDTLRKEL